MYKTVGYESVNTWSLLAPKDLSNGIIVPYFTGTFQGRWDSYESPFRSICTRFQYNMDTTYVRNVLDWRKGMIVNV